MSCAAPSPRRHALTVARAAGPPLSRSATLRTSFRTPLENLDLDGRCHQIEKPPTVEIQKFSPQPYTVRAECLRVTTPLCQRPKTRRWLGEFFSRLDTGIHTADRKQFAVVRASACGR